MSEYERCLVCDDLTGYAGKGEDSLYHCNVGPFCEKCYDLVSPIVGAAREESHQERLEQLKMARKEGREEVLEMAMAEVAEEDSLIGDHILQSYQERFSEQG